jgi:LEA14-like dessication related protein
MIHWRIALFGLPMLLLAACAGMPESDAPRVDVVGIEALPSEGLELRFAVKLRVQNPNEAPIDYDGVALDLEVNGKRLASGVGDSRGTVPRFGETVLSVPVTVTAMAALRQAMGIVQGESLEQMPYRVRGKLAGGRFRAVRFSSEGTLGLPGTAK